MRQEAIEIETAAGESRLHQGRHKGGGARQAFHLDIVGHALAHEQESRVGDAGSAGVAHEGHLLMAFDFGKKPRHLTMLVEDVVRHAAFVNLIVFQQLGGSSGVLTEDQIHGAKHIQRAQCDVLQIADGSRNDVEFHCGRIWSAKIRKKRRGDTLNQNRIFGCLVGF